MKHPKAKRDWEIRQSLRVSGEGDGQTNREAAPRGGACEGIRWREQRLDEMGVPKREKL